MADTFLDEVVQSNAPSRARAAQSAPIELVEGEGGRAKPTAPPVERNESDVADDAPISGRVLPQSVRDRFAAISAARATEAPTDDDPDAPPGEVVEAVDATDGAAAELVVDPDAPPGEAKPVVAKVEAAPAADDPVAKLQAEISKREAANRALYEEFETFKKTPREVAPADKLLQEAAKSYLDDETAALRKFIAAGLGVADPNAPEVEAEMRDLYSDWTAKELGVTPDTAHQAKRDAARTRRQWEREKRERKAQEQSSSAQPAQDEQAKAEKDAADNFITPTLASKSADFPYLTSLAQELHGITPGLLVAKVIRREIKTGRLDPNQSDEALVTAAAKLVETDYQALVEKINKAKPPSLSSPPSTAQPNGKPSAAASSARPDTRQSHGARTLTAADASVAPATPPASKPAKKDDKPPQFKSDEERRKWALRHLRQPKRT
jgi:hypothetical protein